MSGQQMDTRAVSYEFEVEMKASADRVWRALVEETDAWWLPDFHMVGEGSKVHLDARAGGHLIEEQPGGGSLMWYTVQMCSPGQSLHLVGHLGAEWGGPATTMLSLTLEERGDTTVLTVKDALHGHVSKTAPDSLEAGWRQLFTDGLSAYLSRA